MSTNDGIHYDRWQRGRDLDAALREIVFHIVPSSFKDDYLDRFRGDHDEERRRADAVIHEMERRLVDNTGCEPATARGHVSKWLRRFHKRILAVQRLPVE